MEQSGLLILNGLSWGMAVFLIASGLTLVFGILQVLNFAHGGVVMIGAYVTYTLMTKYFPSMMATFFVAILLSCVAIGIIGLAVNRVVFTRLKSVSEAYSLIATYALLMLCQGVVKLIWGIDILSLRAPDALAGAVPLFGIQAPSFVVFVIVAGLLLFAVMDFVLYRTEVGKMVQSVAMDPWMSAALGVNVNAYFTGTVVVGFALAGLAGAILSLNQSLAPTMGAGLIIQAFGAIIVGGLGNMRGAFLATLLLGLATTFGDWLFDDIPGLFFYVTLIAILLFRPQGLLRGVR